MNEYTLDSTLDPGRQFNEDSSSAHCRAFRGRRPRRHARCGDGELRRAADDAKHFFWAQGQADPNGIVNSATNDLIYHGGNAGSGAIGVETSPAVYLVWWARTGRRASRPRTPTGACTRAGRCRTTCSRCPWADVQAQYCSGALVGSTNCLGAAGFVGNPKHQLKGVWVDPSPVPDDIVTLGLAQNLVDDPIAQEAIKASAHFGYDASATYIVLVGPKPVATGQPVYCGYHSQTTSISGLGNPYRLQYAFIPWQNTNWPGIGEGCGMHSVNARSDAFGNGIFDGWSIVTGHEYSEAVTDPDNFLTVRRAAHVEQRGVDAGKDGCAVSRWALDTHRRSSIH